MADKVYRVKGALAQVQTTTAAGSTLVYIYKGGVLPSDVDADTIKHLLDVDLIEEFDESTDVAPDEKVPAKQQPAKAS